MKHVLVNNVGWPMFEHVRDVSLSEAASPNFKYVVKVHFNEQLVSNLCLARTADYRHVTVLVYTRVSSSHGELYYNH